MNPGGMPGCCLSSYSGSPSSAIGSGAEAMVARVGSGFSTVIPWVSNETVGENGSSYGLMKCTTSA